MVLDNENGRDQLLSLSKEGLLEAKDDTVNVQEIMEKIRDNIEKKKKGGAYTNDDATLLSMPCNLNPYGVSTDHNYTQELLSNCDITADYVISSHRKIVGPMLVKGRQLINGEVKRYVDPCLEKQSKFNECVLKVVQQVSKLNEDFTGFSKENEKLIAKVSKLEKILDNQIGSMSWEDFYRENVTESDLQGNVQYHQEFISQIRECADKSAGGKIPRLIEVGLGTATFSIYLSRVSYDITGVDNSIYIIGKAMETNKRLGGYAKFILIDAFDLDMFKDKYFDVAYSQGTLEHFSNEDIIKLLKKQLTIAKYVAFSVPSINWPRREYGNERKMTVEQWKILLMSANFNIVYLDYYQNDAQISCILKRDDV